ncbi:carbamoyl-phosphate synthase small subunit [Treponema ruminis]|uniref:Carbamoyl phosphate synthase small chain n=1 Tax=Treponema ruminis TaxID=744515 RepID=A0A7W8G7U8_9SPIR|nr:carbamoyl phosphate synthase small subunit [Treponema ruminis]MBB5225473.1 carbamoyl-phosphate synthase small subunit [Treponema ruminis]QSI01658.1 carbamoyl-phosphate synthase small subunit [Treponema ruminis]
MSKAYLILADGSFFEGNSIGAEGKTIGETVFTTGMTGYVETLTDPSYFGQIVTQTFPLIGNYGVQPEDFESKKSWVRGYIVRELCDGPSNFRCQGDLDSFLKAQNIVGICGIDTRKLTKILREAGVMNGMIISGQEAEKIGIKKADDGSCQLVSEAILKEIKEYKIENAVESVQSLCKEKGGDFKGQRPLGEGVAENAEGACSEGETSPVKFSVCLFDFGAKANIERELEKRGCKVTVLPYDATAQDVIELNPDGIMLSNGPGDPAENVSIIEEIRKLCQSKIPIFGICLGHQMLALARGAKTSKLKYGHRGGNHPVKDLESGRVYITSQNHGYAVESDTIPAYAKLSFVNANDNTCEGLTYTDIPAFSVQFHPEACGGPHDTNFLFDRFIAMMQEK